ncbi:hypothetical protein Q5M87_05055 [Brachyspira innocens]|uniref:Lipocalin-like domain-containing protein n=1 Tax=Brachyspira innocens TaxID=13264 RepID=A0ABT8Z0M0_9SPIR|nr:hypothetical protein [Brachyspira innocens]MDO6993374.1 hypothetical protein [Brachyspira innocens]MDO7021018.1 hypothetical protein [Brachyspira innocens]
MQKQIKILLTILIALVLSVSCSKNNPNDPTKTKEQMLQQKWKYTNYDGGYDITADKIDGYAGTAVNYSLSIEEIVWYSDNASGMIYCKYTTAPSYNPDVANKYYAIAFKDLTDTTVKISGASKQLEDGSYDSSAETLQEAKTKFTEANGYFSYSELTVAK